MEVAPNGEAAKVAAAEQDALIMALWGRRESLPDQLAVDRRFRAASQLLGALSDRTAFGPLRSDPPSVPADAIEEFGDLWKLLVATISVLTATREAKELGPEDPDLPLSVAEVEERDRWDRLRMSLLLGTDMDWRPNGLKPDLSEDETIALLEKCARERFAEARVLLDGLEAMVLGKERGRLETSMKFPSRSPKKNR